ncbi:MAG: alpha/beta hydrolase [Pyrinomonadaceae bacterium]
MNFESNNLEFSYAQISDVRLHYATAGTGEHLVVLLHGFPEFWYSWRHQIEALSRDFTVVAPDLRGYNLSSKPLNVKDYEIDNLVDDVTGLIRHFGREQAAVVGHDWGAIVAWKTALKYPEYVWKLAALQVPPSGALQQNMTLRQFLASWYLFFFQIPRLPEWLMRRKDFALLERVLTKTATQNVFSSEDIAKYKKSWSEDGAITAAVNYYRANVFKSFFGKTNLENSSGKIKVPTLFIYGEKDTAILPETVRNVQQFVDAPYLELRIPNASHWVQQEAATEVSDALLKFLKD